MIGLLSFALLLLQAAPAQVAQPAPAATALGGPFATQVTPTSALIMWIPEPVTVRFGTFGRLEGVTRSVPGAMQMRLTNLRPGTLYQYEVPGAGRGSFVTAPDPAAVMNYTFVAFGDNRTRHDMYRKVAAAVTAVKPMFVVHTGDMVEDGDSMDLWTTFFDISREMLRNTVLYPALGNHEKNTPYWHQFFGESPGYYAFDWGKAHWAILNTDVDAISNSQAEREAYWTAQLTWLEKDLEKNNAADFTFVVGHHPPFTAMQNRKMSAAAIADRIVPIMKRYKVSAYIAGHDHNYQRHMDAGIPYVVSGGGGAPLYELDAPIPGVTVAYERVENFVVGRVTGRSIHFEARTVDGRIIDKFDLAARKP